MPSDTEQMPKQDGHHSGPGTQCGPSVLLTVPVTLTSNLSRDGLNRLNAIQIEFARDVTLLQSRAYDAILKTVFLRDEN